MVSTINRGGLLTLALVCLTGTTAAHGQIVCGGLEHGSFNGGQVTRVGRGKVCLSDLSLLRGAEVFANSAGGAGLAIDMDELLAQPGAEARVRYRGWDGMIRGTLRTLSNGDGTGTIQIAMDSAPVEGYEVTSFDEAGNQISVEYFPGTILNKPWVPNFFCSDGSRPVLVTRWVTLCNSCAPVLFIGWACANGEEHAFGNQHARMIVRPRFAPGVPVDGSVGSMIVTGDRVSQLFLSDQSLECGPMSLHGLGDAVLTESCNSSSGCPETFQRRREIRNIGSSGQDGVSIRSTDDGLQTYDLEIPEFHQPGAMLRAEFAMRSAGVEHSGWIEVLSGPDRFQISPNYPTLSPDGVDLYSIDELGGVIGHIFVPHGVPIDADVNFCPPPGVPIWGWMWWNDQWVWGIYACAGVSVGPDLHNSDLFVTGPRVVIVPVNDPPVVDSMVTTLTGSNLPSGFTVTNMALRSPPATCPADFNADGFLDFFDYDDYVVAFETGLPGADFNGDGFTDFFDYDDFVVAFEHGC